jgi:hypothetical protein
MSYYELLKPEIEKTVSVFAKQFSDCKRKRALFLKRQSDAKALLVRLQERKSKLTGLADESLAKDVNSFEKFKVDLKKINAEIEATSEAVSALTDKIIPAQHKEESESEQELKSKLIELWKSHQRGCEGKMAELLDEIARLQEDFFSAFARFADECGLGFEFFSLCEVYHLIYTPQPRHPCFEVRIIGGGWNRPAVPVESAQDAETPAEGSLIAPEAGSQAVEALNPSVEVSGAETDLNGCL